MNEQNEPSSRGPLTLKFFGVDNEATSDEEEEEEEETHIPTHTSDSLVNTCNGNNHNLIVNRCYGNNKKQ